MPKIVELRPDRSLLNTRFETYQFSSDSSPTVSEIQLETDIFRLELTPDKESWLEVRLFALHNHLFKNPYDTSCWFVDKDGVIWRWTKAKTLQRIHKLHSAETQSWKPLYNPSIDFTVNKISVISDGDSTLELLKENSSGVFRSFVLKDAEPGVILNVQYVEAKCQVVITLCSIADMNKKKCTELVLLFYACEHSDNSEESYSLQNRQTLMVKGAVEYFYTEDNGEYVHSICQDNIIFPNSGMENDQQQEGTENNKQQQMEPENIKIPKYYWSQDEDSLTVKIKIPEKYQHTQPKVVIKATELSVMINNEILIQGNTLHRLDVELTTWKREKDMLQLDLIKSESGLMWNELIKGDTEGECLPNEALAAEIHSRLSHLCTNNPDATAEEGQPYMGFSSNQLEECDLEGKETNLQRISLTSRETTHLAMLGSNNYILLTYKTKYGQAICLRQENDACVWLVGKVESDAWDIEHIITFPGFGYVQASKSNRKFCVCAPDGSYAAIIEHTKQVFLYENPKKDSQVAKQWIVNLECEDFSIMGAVAMNKLLLILTKDKLYQLQVHL